jgi:hypothetical protein
MTAMAMEAMKQSDGSPGSRKLRIPEGRDDDAGYNAQQPATIKGPAHLHIIMTSSPLGDAIANTRRLDSAKRRGSISEGAQRHNSRWQFGDQDVRQMRALARHMGDSKFDGMSDEDMISHMHAAADQMHADGKEVPAQFHKGYDPDVNGDSSSLDQGESPADDTVSAKPRRMQLKDELQARRTAAYGQTARRARGGDALDRQSGRGAQAGGPSYPGDQVSRASGI